MATCQFDNRQTRNAFALVVLHGWMHLVTSCHRHAWMWMWVVGSLWPLQWAEHVAPVVFRVCGALVQ